MATIAMHSGYVGTNGPYPGCSAPLSTVSTGKGISGTSQFRSNEDPRSERPSSTVPAVAVPCTRDDKALSSPTASSSFPW